MHPRPLMAGELFSPGKIGFVVKVNGERIPYHTFGIYVLPGNELSFEVVDGGAVPDFDLTLPAAWSPTAAGSRRVWRAPQEPGTYPIEIRSRRSGESMRLNVFVMVPFRRGHGEAVEGYRIGSYPRKALRGLKIYEAPRGLVRVSRETMNTLVSPHFTLGQFLCKQDGDFPKFVVLRERLLLKLEYLLQVVNEKGFPTSSFHVMSGFRTPYYNHAIGNVRYSRHQWGDAADIFIDENPRDGLMDDLDGNGRIDRKDGDLLYELFEGLTKRASYEPFIGGMGVYGTTTAHGPFVHVDARGFRARW